MTSGLAQHRGGPMALDHRHQQSIPRYLVHLPPRPALQFSWHAESSDGQLGHLSGPAGWNLVGTGNWELTNAEGERWTFVGFERKAHPKGRLISYQGPGGRGYAVYDPADPDNPQADPYTEAGHIKGHRYTYTYAGSPLREYLDFSYATGADGHERLAAATLRRQEGDSAVENVRRVLSSISWPRPPVVRARVPTAVAPRQRLV